jgi:hypothetical protein
MNQDNLNANQRQYVKEFAIKKERRKLIKEAVNGYNAYSLTGLSEIVTRVKKNLHIIDKDSNTSKQVEAQNLKHFVLKKMISKKMKKVESLITATGAAGTFFNYSTIRDALGNALGLKQSTFDLQNSLNSNFLNTVSEHANSADGAVMLTIAVSLTALWYHGQKSERTLHRKPIEERLALYGDNDPSLKTVKGEIQKSIDNYSKIPLHSFISNLTDSWGSKTSSYTKLLAQNTILTIHKFKQNKLYNFLESFIGEKKLESLRNDTSQAINNYKSKIKKTRKRFFYKTIYERQTAKLKELNKHKEVLSAGETYRKRINKDVNKINDNVYSEMLKTGIHQALKRSAKAIFLSKDKNEVIKGLNVLVELSDLNNILTSDGINKYTIVSKTATKILKDYRTLKSTPSNSKEVANKVKILFRSELFKFGQKEINKIEKADTQNISSELILKENLSEMSFVGYKGYRKVINDKINEFCNEEKLKDQTIKESRGFSSVGLYETLNKQASLTLSDSGKKSVERYKTESTKRKNRKNRVNPRSCQNQKNSNIKTNETINIAELDATISKLNNSKFNDNNSIIKKQRIS